LLFSERLTTRPKREEKGNADIGTAIFPPYHHHLAYANSIEINPHRILAARDLNAKGQTQTQGTRLIPIYTKPHLPSFLPTLFQAHPIHPRSQTHITHNLNHPKQSQSQSHTANLITNPPFPLASHPSLTFQNHQTAESPYLSYLCQSQTKWGGSILPTKPPRASLG